MIIPINSNTMRGIISVISIVSCSALFAQVKTLPYKNQFETSGDRSAFVSVRTGPTSASDWGFNTMTNGFAAHDYPVGGSSTDTVSDWLFSPPINITSGAVLSFKYSVYGITGTAAPEDELSVWYGKNSRNPSNGTYVKVADLTNKISSNFGLWLDTADIALPSASDSGYIVFRYKATNNWFVVAVDSVVVKMPGLSIGDPIPGWVLKAELMPNPATEILYVNASSPIRNIRVMSMDGKVLYASAPSADLETIEVAGWEAGVYMVRIETANGIMSRTFIKH